MKIITLEVEDHVEISQIVTLLQSHNIKVRAEKKPNVSEKLALLEKSKGTICVPWNLADKDLNRENLYEDEGI